MSRKRAMIKGWRLRDRDGWESVRPCQREIDRYWRMLRGVYDEMEYPHHYGPQPGLLKDVP